MGHSRLAVFELQLETTTKGRVLCTGVDSFREAKKTAERLLNSEDDEFTGKIFLWGNNSKGKSIIENKGGDYLEANFYEDKKFKPRRIIPPEFLEDLK